MTMTLFGYRILITIDFYDFLVLVSIEITRNCVWPHFQKKTWKRDYDVMLAIKKMIAVAWTASVEVQLRRDC